MNALLAKALAGQPATDADIAESLFETCDNVHTGCDSTCPVYAANNNHVPNTTGNHGGCDCFKNGKAMLAFLRSHT